MRTRDPEKISARKAVARCMRLYMAKQMQLFTASPEQLWERAYAQHLAAREAEGAAPSEPR